jgi:hypothetical protein
MSGYSTAGRTETRNRATHVLGILVNVLTAALTFLERSSVHPVITGALSGSLSPVAGRLTRFNARLIERVVLTASNLPGGSYIHLPPAGSAQLVLR